MTNTFQAIVDELRQRFDLPAVSAAYVLPDGSVETHVCGYADIERNEKLTPGGRFLAASIGKTFVSAWALALVNEGKIGLNDNLIDWLGSEDWIPRLANAEDITLRSLLNHSAGIADHVYDESFGESGKVRRSSNDPDDTYTPRELIEFILDKPALAQVGEKCLYTDTGYIIAGLMLNKASGSTFYDEVERRFLDPLGLSDIVPSNSRRIPRQVVGYVDPSHSLGVPPRNMENGVLVYSPGSEWTGGGFSSTPSGLVQWAQVLYEDRALPSSYLGELIRDPMTREDRPNMGYGLGVIIRYDSNLGLRLGHSGWTPGYISWMNYYPDHHVGTCWMINSDPPSIREDNSVAIEFNGRFENAVRDLL